MRLSMIRWLSRRLCEVDLAWMRLGWWNVQVSWSLNLCRQFLLNQLSSGDSMADLSFDESSGELFHSRHVLETGKGGNTTGDGWQRQKFFLLYCKLNTSAESIDVSCNPSKFSPLVRYLPPDKSHSQAHSAEKHPLG